MNKDLDEGAAGSGDDDDGDDDDDYIADGVTQGGTVDDLEKYM